jgi:hypothetical protein
VTLGYAGSRGLNLISTKDGNPRPYSSITSDGRFFWTGQEARFNPNWTGITYHTAAASSWYNSLQFSLQKRLSRGLQFQSSYTFGKLIDFRQGGTVPDTGGSSYKGTADLPWSLDKGRGDADVSHSWRFNSIYRLPQAADLTGPAGALLNGWWVSGILTLQTGTPFSVTTGGTDRSRSLGAGNTPDLIPGRNNDNVVSGTTVGCNGFAAGQKLGTPDLYFDPCAFSPQPNGTLGTVGRNIFTSPGLANLDFSFVKDTQLSFLGEGGSLQFRAEMFNILNRANFGRPGNRSIYSFTSTGGFSPVATAGQIDRTDTTSRQIQLALKVIW